MPSRRILKVATPIGGMVATLLAVSTNVLAAESAKSSPSADERKAIQVVTSFVQNMHHSPCKAGTYLADNLKWRAGPDEDIKHGRDTAVKFLQGFSDPASPMSKTLQITSVEIVASSAYGGTGDVLVIQPRLDIFSGNGKARKELAGAFFRVDPRTWKIQEWLDTPLNIFTPSALPPLPGVEPGKAVCPPGSP